MYWQIHSFHLYWNYSGNLLWERNPTNERIYLSHSQTGGGDFGVCDRFYACDRYHSALLPYGMFTSEYPSSEHLSKLRWSSWGCFNLIIGVELIRMMYSHSPSTVFEVLLFAIARHIIMDHSSIYSSLIGVCSIAVLFATRKYLFSEFDVADETVFRASTKAKVVNKILSVNIPHKTDDTLADVLLPPSRRTQYHSSCRCLLLLPRLRSTCCETTWWKNFENSGNSCYTLTSKHAILHISDRLTVRITIVRFYFSYLMIV